MEYKILESNGVEVENVDGAAFNNFVSSNRSGVLHGILNECSVYSPSSNSVGVSTGELLIKGFRVKITDPFFYTFQSLPSVDTVYQILARITLRVDRAVLFEMVVNEATGELTQDNLYATEQGVYEIQIAQFTIGLNGVSNLVATADVLRGSSRYTLYRHSLTFETLGGPGASCEVYSSSVRPITLTDWMSIPLSSVLNKVDNLSLSRNWVEVWGLLNHTTTFLYAKIDDLGDGTMFEDYTTYPIVNVQDVVSEV
jgi:hypothetical protein